VAVYFGIDVVQAGLLVTVSLSARRFCLMIDYVVRVVVALATLKQVSVGQVGVSQCWWSQG